MMKTKVAPFYLGPGVVKMKLITVVRTESFSVVLATEFC